MLFIQDPENSVNNENHVDITTTTEKQYLLEFIKKWDLFRAMEYVN